MKEAELRTWHRKAGIGFAVFIALQAVTGIVLTIEDMLGSYWGGIVHDIHRRYELAGDIYRLIAGIGMMYMLITGVWILIKIRQRTKRSALSR